MNGMLQKSVNQYVRYVHKNERNALAQYKISPSKVSLWNVQFERQLKKPKSEEPEKNVLLKMNSRSLQGVLKKKEQDRAIRKRAREIQAQALENTLTLPTATKQLSKSRHKLTKMLHSR